MLQRLTFLQTISSLRRINSPSLDSSTQKLTSPRHLHATQKGFICPAETPEGIKVGLVKNLSLLGNVTISMESQIYIIKDFLEDKVKDLRDISPLEVSKNIKVFLNGEWLGIVSDGQKLYEELREKKLTVILKGQYQFLLIYLILVLIFIVMGVGYIDLF